MKRIVTMITLLIGLNLILSGQERSKIFENELPKASNLSNAVLWAAENTVRWKKTLNLKDDSKVIIGTVFYFPPEKNELLKYLKFKLKYQSKIEVKDHRYKASLDHPVLKISAKGVEMRYLSSKELEQYERTLETVIRIGEEHFTGLSEWDCEKIPSLITHKKQEIYGLKTEKENLSSKRKDRKRKKRIDYRLERIEDELLILENLENKVEEHTLQFFSDLEKSMSKSEDW